MMSPICKISKIQQTKEANSYKNKTKQKKKQTHEEQTHGNQWGMGLEDRVNIGEKSKRHKLLSIK